MQPAPPIAALVVVDLQRDFFESGPLADLRETLTARTNELVAIFRERDLPVVWVRQEFADDLSDAFLLMRRRGTKKTIAGTPGAEFLPELQRDARDPVVLKKRYSAFFRTNLDELLSTSQPQHLVIAGINTHACVRMTAIDAYQRDYSVIIAEECVASYDAEHHAVTRRYMQGGIAEFLSNERIRGLLDSNAP